MSAEQDAGLPEVVTYEAFGRQFLEIAVNEERIVGGVSVLAGQPISFGPIGVGPGRIAQVTARGQIGQPTSTRITGPEVSFRVVLPVQLDFTVDLQVDTHRFAATLAVPVVLTAKALDGLVIFIDAVPPRAAEVGIELQAQGLRASLLQRVAGVEGEVQRFVAKFVAKELDKPHIRKARTIDVAGALTGAWSSIGPRDGDAPPVGRHFAEAAATELEVTEVSELDATEG